MARAKQTTRADARRRYRQALAQPAGGDDDAPEGVETAPSRADRGTAASPTSGAKPASSAGRGILGAFRGAYRPADVRADVSVLPELVRGRWFLVSLGLVALGFVGGVVLPSGVGGLAFQMLTLPPAMVPIFLVGFTAPRASYLLGLIIGVVDVALYTFFFVYFGAVSGIAVSPTDALLTGAEIGIPASLLFSAAAAWYKRFLALSSPRRQQAGRGQQSGRGASGTRSAAKAASRR